MIAKSSHCALLLINHDTYLFSFYFTIISLSFSIKTLNFKIKILKVVIAYVLRVHNYLPFPLSTYINSIILLYWGTYFSIACRSHFFSNAMIDAKFAPFFKTFYDLFCVVRGQFTSHFALYKLYILHEKPLILFRYLDFCFIVLVDFFFHHNIQVCTYYSENTCIKSPIIYFIEVQSPSRHRLMFYTYQIPWWNIFLKDGHTVQ